MAKLVSKTYGDALFRLAAEENFLDAAAEEAQAVLDAFAENEELLKLLNHPKITREEKLRVVENIFKGRLSDSMTGFLITIVQKGRQNEIPEILQYFLKQVMEYKSIGTAKVTSAVPLTQEQKAAVKKRLLEVTNYVEFNMNYEVDPALIGGLVIRIGDRVVDSSIRTQLANMSKDLMKLQLKKEQKEGAKVS